MTFAVNNQAAIYIKWKSQWFKVFLFSEQHAEPPQLLILLIFL